MQQMMTTTHVTMRSLTRTEEGVGDELYKGSLFSPNLYDDVHTKGTNCCGSD